NLGKETAEQEKNWLTPRVWVGPAILSTLLLIEMILLLLRSEQTGLAPVTIQPKQVALSLYGQYIIGLELVGFLLMAGIVGAAHIGKHKKKILHRYLLDESDQKQEPLNQTTDATYQ